MLNKAVITISAWWAIKVETLHSATSSPRSQAVLELVKLKPTVIRGNASEIMAVAGAAGVTTRGVDSTAEAEEALELGKRLARESGCIVAISGATDLVSCVPTTHCLTRTVAREPDSAPWQCRVQCLLRLLQILFQ